MWPQVMFQITDWPIANTIIFAVYFQFSGYLFALLCQGKNKTIFYSTITEWVKILSYETTLTKRSFK